MFMIQKTQQTQRTQRSPARRSAVGYALLEAMIAVIVAAVGFIGAARMQTFGMKLNASAQLRQKATLLGYQMTDRIRANQAGADAGAYDNLTASNNNACLSSTAGCAGGAAVAASDYTEWLRDVTEQLPGGTGVVCKDSTPETPVCDGVGNVITVNVGWSDNVSTGLPSRFVTLVRTSRETAP